MNNRIIHPDLRPVVDTPLRPLWKTHVVATIIGVAVGFVMVNAFTPLNPLLGLWIDFIFLFVSLFYAMEVYPSFFASRPMLKNPKAISFLNGLFGSILFGCLWNYNLTKGEKGISFIFFSFLTAVALCFLVSQLPLST